MGNYPTGMDDFEMNEQRKRLLAKAVAEKFGGNEAELGRALGYTDGSFIRQMLRVGPKSRAITEKTVRKIEQLPGLSAWFSTNIASTEEQTPPSRGAGSRTRQSGALFLHVKSVPVLTFTDLNLMEALNTDARLSSAPRMAASSDAGPRAKAVQLNDDSMAPTMRIGDLIHLDPDLVPQPGNTVLVVDGAGQYHVREYRLRSGGSFEAAAHNAAHATLHSGPDALRVVAVATHLTHSLIGRGSLLGQVAGSLLGIVGALFVGTALYVGEFGPNDSGASRRPGTSIRAGRRRWTPHPA